MASKNDLAVHSDKLRAFMGRDIRRYFLSALKAAFGRSSFSLVVADTFRSAPSYDLEPRFGSRLMSQNAFSAITRRA